MSANGELGVGEEALADFARICLSLEVDLKEGELLTELMERLRRGCELDRDDPLCQSYQQNGDSSRFLLDGKGLWHCFFVVDKESGELKACHKLSSQSLVQPTIHGLFRFAQRLSCHGIYFSNLEEAARELRRSLFRSVVVNPLQLATRRKKDPRLFKRRGEELITCLDPRFPTGIPFLFRVAENTDWQGRKCYVVVTSFPFQGNSATGVKPKARDKRAAGKREVRHLLNSYEKGELAE
ncbi:MAG: hypothetical protein HY982_03150 [Candidatus Magasanikbacteria bacterium]|nr:hypothetical protein [Candidatus Magasanikbacteria bacterium]